MTKKKNNKQPQTFPPPTKGNLYKREDGQWMVRAVTWVPMVGPVAIHEWKLHPDDVVLINEHAQRFDNIEARIAADPTVYFEVQTIATGTSEWDVMDEDVAKLIQR